jgi:[ribosomal protein S5]-alanine N-acetyltransferase
MEVLRTERLILREFEERDAEGFFALNNDPEVMRYTGDRSFASVEESLQLIRNYTQYSMHGMGRWSMERIGTGELIGWCGLKRHDDGMVDLGYRLHQRFWGSGYATEAAKASIDHGFNTLGLDHIVGRTARANLASVHVLEKCGMYFWKVAECEGIADSVWYRVDRP